MSAHPLADQTAVLELLDAWVARGWLRRLDRAFVRFIARESGSEPTPLVLLAAALASHQLGRGHVSLDLERALAEPEAVLSLPPDDGGDVALEPQQGPLEPASVLAHVTPLEWHAALAAQPQIVGAGPGSTPLVLCGTRLYLRRYWHYEQEVRAAITRRLQAREALGAELSVHTVRALLDTLFGLPQAGAPDWQRVACALAVKSAFAIITGGPGTGKTTTVLRLLVLLQGLAQEHGDRAVRIRLAAPTGKAAARLAESVSGALDRMPWAALPGGAALRAQIPTTVTTLHRLLGRHADARRYRFDARNPLALDVLVIDEASMVDLEMLAAVMAALPAHARLIVLGDKDQLSSVEAGAVFGALCARAEAAAYDGATRAWLAEAAGVELPPGPAGGALEQAVAMLRTSHRFGGDSDIGRFAAAINAGDAGAVRAQLARAGDDADVAWLPVRSPSATAFSRLVLDAGYRPMLAHAREARPAFDAGEAAFDVWAREVLAAQRRFQLLCALRRGEYGVEGLNRRIAEGLHGRGWIAAVEGWYAGRPVLVTRNDYDLGVMNGDVGVVLERPDGEDAEGRPRWALRVAFAASDGSDAVRWLLPSRLGHIETVFAMTVHKSQGSEFDHVVLVLPERPNPGLSRELLYTGVTRARARVTLVGAGNDAEAVLAATVTRRAFDAGGFTVGLPAGAA